MRILIFNLNIWFFSLFKSQSLHLLMHLSSHSYQGFIEIFLNFIESHRHCVGSLFGSKRCHLVILHQVLFYCLVFRLLNRRSHTISIVFIWSLSPTLQIHVMISIRICICRKLSLIKQIRLILFKTLKEIIEAVWTLGLEGVCLEIIHWNALGLWSIAKTHVQ